MSRYVSRYKSGEVSGEVSVPTPSMMGMSEESDARAQRRQQRRQEIYDAIKDTLGYRFASTVEHHWKTSTFTTFEQAVNDMRGGVVASLNCRGRGRKSRSPHQVRFLPNGTIELLNHPSPINEDAERMLSALGSPMPECIAVALCFPRRVRVGEAGLNVGARQPLDGRLRSLWAAVTWAQDPDTVWSKSLGDHVLHYGVTLPEARQWLDAGWSMAQAKRFWKQWATFDVAELWRAAGKTGAADAVAAGLGQCPDDDARWEAAGFTRSKAARWRKNTNLSPEEAFMWESWGCPPTEVKRVKDLPRRVAGLDMDTVMEWCHAGVPASYNSIQGWWTITHGDLDLSVKWARTGTAPSYAQHYEDWNAEHPEHVLTPEVVSAYIDAGLPATIEHVSRAHVNGIVPEQIKNVLTDPALLPHGYVEDMFKVSVNLYSRNGQVWTRDKTRRAARMWVRSDTFSAATRLLGHLEVALAREPAAC